MCIELKHAEVAADRVFKRADYRPVVFQVVRLQLEIDIWTDECIVHSRMQVERVAGAPVDAPLVLDGVKLDLQSVSVDGRLLESESYRADESAMRIDGLGNAALIEIVTRISLTRDHGYMGIYREGTTLVADTEPEGFRHITFFPDRPDHKTLYDVTLIADRQTYPTLLSNGHRVACGDLPEGRHFVRWQDPVPKGSHVFTMIAGRYSQIVDEFVTASGRRVELVLNAAAEEIEQCRGGLQIMKRAMQWDEQHYGREYDLDLFNIVVLPNYNQGGMEYRGLNIFSSANFRPAGMGIDDETKMKADSVVGHEYFHNWTGNRVSCRDWFNLTVKEGFVVFKSQEFSADLTDPALQRILDVRFLREYQFPEDDSETAQAPRPDSYLAVQNLYTRTTYEKSAEIARMLRRILGPAQFRAGCDLFYARHDSNAVQIEDFVRCFETVSGRDLQQFLRWYTQPGRPELSVEEEYEPAQKTYTLRLWQSCRAVSASAAPLPFLIPVSVGLLDDAGREMPLRLEGEAPSEMTDRTFELEQQSAVFKFIDVPSPPTLSILRDCSAPVSVRISRSCRALAKLALHDTDAFNRWDASQELAVRLVLDAVDARSSAGDRMLYHETLATLLSQSATSRIVGLQLRRPSEGTIGLGLAQVDVDGIHRERVRLERDLAATLSRRLLETYYAMAQRTQEGYTPGAVAGRILKNECLALLAMTGSSEALALCRTQLASSRSLTDALGALKALLAAPADDADAALEEFRSQRQHDGPVMESWFALQASTERPETAVRLRRLVEQKIIRLDNPTALRSLFDQFARNQIGFHEGNGEGYRLVVDVALALNDINPRMGARFMLGFKTLRRFDAMRQQLMREQLQRITRSSGLASELYEIARACSE